MNGEEHQIGRRVRYWRLRRNLGRKQFADMVGRSTSWLDKVESGERALARVPMIERVAEALGIDPTALTEVVEAERARRCVDASEVLAIKQALGWYPGLVPASGASDFAAVKRQAEYLDHAWHSSRFTVVARHLPKLMVDAQHGVEAASSADRVAASRVLVTTYRLASSMLLKFETNDIAWLAADRAMHSALAVDDTWSLARATRSVARAMSGTRQHGEAIGALLAMTDRMRAEAHANERELLSLYGMLYLAASITAAGLTNAMIHRVSALVRLHEGGRALEFATTIDPAGVNALSAERRSNFLLDLTEAHASVGNHEQATALLAQAEQVAPEEVRCRPLAHGLLRSLLQNTRGGSAKLVRQMAERAGVAA